MQELLNLLITTSIGLGILGASYALDLLVGSINVLFTKNLKWSWRKMGEDLLKALLIAGSILGWVCLWYIAGWYADKVGLDISQFTNAMSILGMIGAIAIGSFWYLSNAGANLLNFVNTKHIEVKIDESKTDIDAIANKAKEIAEKLTPTWAIDDKQTNTEAEKEATEKYEGQGAFVNPLDRRLPDGDTDNGKGWQCSKYSYYLATGIRMNYAPHPDYGPCNGCDMVNYLITNCGYKQCGKMNGAIFAYSAGSYGHTGMVVDAANNIVNDANWVPLTVSTHYLNLESVGAVYCCPPEMVPPTPTPQPTPTPAPEPSKGFKVGDVVKPIRLVDYNGTPLVQFDNTYTISELDGDRAVLTAPRNGKQVVWAAMNTKDIVKA